MHSYPLSKLPTIVLLPGLDGSGVLFEPLLAMLGSSVKTLVIRYEPNCELGYSELINFVKDHIKQNLTPDEPYILLGESFSGPIAIEIASSRTSGLVGLILCTTFAQNPQPKLSAIGRWIDWLPMPINFANNIAANFVLLGKHTTPTLRQLIARGLSSLTNKAIRSRLTEVINVDVRAALIKIKIPIFYLQAKHDLLVTPKALDSMLALNSSIEVAKFDTAHCLLQIDPVRASEEILKFADATRHSEAFKIVVIDKK